MFWKSIVQPALSDFRAKVATTFDGENARSERQTMWKGMSTWRKAVNAIGTVGVLIATFTAAMLAPIRHGDKLHLCRIPEGVDRGGGYFQRI